MSEKEKQIQDGAPAPAPKEPPRESDHPPAKKPIWAILTLVLIGLSTIALLVLANIQLHVQQRTLLFTKDLTPVAILEGDECRWGYLNESGEMTIPAIYEQAQIFSPNGLAAVKKDGAWGYINTVGEVVIPYTLEDTLGFADNALAPAKQYGIWGYINRKGEFAIPPQFDSAIHFADCGLALVSIDGKYGYITRSGAYAILPQFADAKGFNEDGYAAVLAYNRWGMIDKNGDFIINPRFEWIGDFSNNGISPVRCGGKYGYVDRNGNYTVAPNLHSAGGFSNGLAPIQSEENSPWGYVNEKGEIVIPAQFSSALPFASNGLAAVAVKSDGDTERWGYINKQGEFVIAPTFDEAWSFGTALAAVKKDGTCHYISEQGDTVITLAQGESGGRFTDDGYALVGKDGVLRIIDKTGAPIHTQDLARIDKEILLYSILP